MLPRPLIRNVQILNYYHFYVAWHRKGCGIDNPSGEITFDDHLPETRLFPFTGEYNCTFTKIPGDGFPGDRSFLLWVRLVVQSGRSINKSPLLMLFIHQHHHQLRSIPDSDVAYPPPRLLLIHLNEGKSIVMIMFYLEKLFAIKIVGALMFVFHSFSSFYLHKK